MKSNLEGRFKIGNKKYYWCLNLKKKDVIEILDIDEYFE